MYEYKIIVLAEDSQADQRLIQRAFKKINRDIDIVEDGESLLAYLSQPPYPSLILLDVNMSPMNGFEALKRIRAENKWRNIPVVILTTSSQNDDIKTAYALGANAYIVKPVSMRKFQEAVGAIDNFWIKLNRELVNE